MLHEFLDGLPQGSFSEQDDPLEARFLDGSDEAFRVGIQIRRAWRQLNRLHSGAFQDLQEFSGEQRIPVMNQISLTDQKAFRSVTEVPSDLAHPEPLSIPRDSGDLNPTTRQVDEEEHQQPGQTLARPGLEGEEIRRHYNLPMPTQKLLPGGFPL